MYLNINAGVSLGAFKPLELIHIMYLNKSINTNVVKNNTLN